MCNYTKKILEFINGQTAISTIARSLIDNGATPEELGSFEADLQTLYDEDIIDAKKITSINAGIQRETKRYSKEQFDQVLNIGVKVKDDNVTVNKVDNSRNRGANKPKDNKEAGSVESLESHIKAIAALCSSFEPEQKKDIVKMLAIELGLKASVSVK